MSETQAILENEPYPQELIQQAYEHREMVLRDLLDPPHSEGSYAYSNYEYAVDSGLIDLFYFDPVHGEDGLVHVLAGETAHDESGARFVAGFHHEESSRSDITYVDRQHLEQKASKARREYQETPFEPYNAHVVIGGYPKSSFVTNEQGEVAEVSVKSTMFPKEYDPIAIMQAARIALDTRDVTKDTLNRSGRWIVTEGEAPMLDGVHTMKLRFFLDPESGKIASVFPITKGRNVMKLTDEATDIHLGIKS